MFSALRSIIFLFLVSVNMVCAQPSPLKASLTSVIQSVSAEVGVAIIDLQTNDTLSINGNNHFPMQSVFKFHIALAALKRVDDGEFSLDKKYHVTKDRYFKTWSVMMRQFPEANMDVTLNDLIIWSVKNSDNVACDMLFEILGGPSSVEQYVKSLGVTDIAIVANEREMHHDWNVQFSNWTTPDAAAHLLKVFHDGKLLSKKSTDLLWQAMVDTPNAPKRLKGMLPDGTAVARKPGTGDTNGEVYGAVNDVGIIVLPSGKKIIIAVFVTRAKDFNAAENIIARISKAAYDHYNK